jgi:Mg-chelatase subunit ChlD
MYSIYLFNIRLTKYLLFFTGTNIQRALVKAGDVAQAATTPLSIVVLLTDGETTVGESEPTLILQAVRAANKHSSK